MLRLLIALLVSALLAFSAGPVSDTEEMVIMPEDEELIVTQYDPPSGP